MSERLRILLDEITADVGALRSFPAHLTAIADEAPHRIQVLAPPSDDLLTEPNCVMHALGLIGKLEDPCTPLGRYYANTQFLQSLIDSGVLRPSDPVDGALVTWSSPGGLRHVGVLATPDRAVSKWSIGYLCQHGLLEVPATYGNNLAFYSPLGPDQDALALLARFHHWMR
jgi:hypothetical protein